MGEETASPTPVTQNFTVSAAPQTINFPSPGTQALGGMPVALAATTTSTLAPVFASITPSVCTVSANTATAVTIGACTITADQSGPKHLNYSLTRAKFEQLVDDLIQRTIAPMEQALKDAGIKPNEIDEVLLVGGSTRIPKIQEIVRKFFGKEPLGQKTLERLSR